ncbi:MAG: hypothetical protein KC561_06390 [Myxococcales bacterium]|nr:hypothetical protein [Myxococcales bacterium]
MVRWKRSGRFGLVVVAVVCSACSGTTEGEPLEEEQYDDVVVTIGDTTVDLSDQSTGEVSQDVGEDTATADAADDAGTDASTDLTHGTDVSIDQGEHLSDASDAALEVDLGPATGTLTVELRNGFGGIPGAPVAVFDSSLELQREGTTDSQGRFEEEIVGSASFVLGYQSGTDNPRRQMWEVQDAKPGESYVVTLPTNAISQLQTLGHMRYKLDVSDLLEAQDGPGFFTFAVTNPCDREILADSSDGGAVPIDLVLPVWNYCGVFDSSSEVETFDTLVSAIFTPTGATNEPPVVVGYASIEDQPIDWIEQEPPVVNDQPVLVDSWQTPASVALTSSNSQLTTAVRALIQQYLVTDEGDVLLPDAIGSIGDSATVEGGGSLSLSTIDFDFGLSQVITASFQVPESLENVTWTTVHNSGDLSGGHELDLETLTSSHPSFVRIATIPDGPGSFVAWDGLIQPEVFSSMVATLSYSDEVYDYSYVVVGQPGPNRLLPLPTHRSEMFSEWTDKQFVGDGRVTATAVSLSDFPSYDAVRRQLQFNSGVGFGSRYPGLGETWMSIVLGRLRVIKG